MDRRKFILNGGVVGAGLLGAGHVSPGLLHDIRNSDSNRNLNHMEEKPVAFTVPPLPYRLTH